MRKDLGRLTSFALLTVFTLGLVACQPVFEEPPVEDGDTTRVATEPPAIIDPTRLRSGDMLRGFRVVSAHLKPSMVGPGEWTADVLFAGQVEITGEFGPHHDYPEPPAICFFPDSLSSRRLPRMPTDGRIAWFCFTNPDSARRWAGEPPGRRRARIVVDDYRYLYTHTDVYNGARLVRVIE